MLSYSYDLFYFIHSSYNWIYPKTHSNITISNKRFYWNENRKKWKKHAKQICFKKKPQWTFRKVTRSETRLIVIKLFTNYYFCIILNYELPSIYWTGPTFILCIDQKRIYVSLPYFYCYYFILLYLHNLRFKYFYEIYYFTCNSLGAESVNKIIIHF